MLLIGLTAFALGLRELMFVAVVGGVLLYAKRGLLPIGVFLFSSVCSYIMAFVVLSPLAVQHSVGFAFSCELLASGAGVFLTNVYLARTKQEYLAASDDRTFPCGENHE